MSIFVDPVMESGLESEQSSGEGNEPHASSIVRREPEQDQMDAASEANTTLSAGESDKSVSVYLKLILVPAAIRRPGNPSITS